MNGREISRKNALEFMHLQSSGVRPRLETSRILKPLLLILLRETRGKEPLKLEEQKKNQLTHPVVSSPPVKHKPSAEK